MPFQQGDEFLVGSGEAFVHALVKRTSAGFRQGPMEPTAVRVEALDDQGQPVTDPTFVYINPRRQMTNDQGEARFDIVPDEERLVRVRVSLPEFPEVDPILKDINAVTSALRPAEATMRLPMLSSTPLEQITTPDHEIGIHVDLSPFRLGIPGIQEEFVVILEAQPVAIGERVYQFSDVDRAVFVDDQIVSASRLPVFGFYVRPKPGMIARRPEPIHVHM